MIIDNDAMFKFLDPKKLAELLQILPAGAVVSTNDVGNLAIYARENNKFTYIGYIDFLHEGKIEYSYPLINRIFALIRRYEMILIKRINNKQLIAKNQREASCFEG